MTQWKGCPRCGKKMPREIRGQCEECKRGRYKALKKLPGVMNGRRQDVYNKGIWIRTRAEVIRRAKGMCEVCYAKGKRKAGKEVHHIIKVRQGNSATHYDLDNLIYVCEECHDLIEGMNHEMLLDFITRGE